MFIVRVDLYPMCACFASQAVVSSPRRHVHRCMFCAVRWEQVHPCVHTIAGHSLRAVRKAREAARCIAEPNCGLSCLWRKHGERRCKRTSAHTVVIEWGSKRKAKTYVAGRCHPIGQAARAYIDPGSKQGTGIIDHNFLFLPKPNVELMVHGRLAFKNFRKTDYGCCLVDANEMRHRDP